LACSIVSAHPTLSYLLAVFIPFFSFPASSSLERLLELGWRKIIIHRSLFGAISHSVPAGESYHQRSEKGERSEIPADAKANWYYTIIGFSHLIDKSEGLKQKRRERGSQKQKDIRFANQKKGGYGHDLRSRFPKNDIYNNSISAFGKTVYLPKIALDLFSRLSD
jgi:hypothetical protein